MNDIELQLNEAKKYYHKAEDEYKQRHYHLVVGNLMYALNIMEEIGEEEDELNGKIYYLLARSHLSLKNYEKVHSFWEASYFFYLERDAYRVCELYNMRGMLMSSQGMNKKAISCYQRVLETIKNDHSEKALPIHTKAFYNLANCYIRIGKHIEARRHYLRAYRLQLKWDNPLLQGQILMGLGVAYQYDHKDISTLRCYEKALQFINPSNYVTFGRLLHNLGDLYLRMEKMEDARDFFEESIKEEHYYKLDRSRVISSLRGLASTYVHSDLEKVKAYSMKALEMILERGVTKFTKIEEKDLAYIYQLLCYWMAQERKLEECKIYLSQAKAIFRKLGLRSEVDKLECLADKIHKRR